MPEPKRTRWPYAVAVGLAAAAAVALVVMHREPAPTMVSGTWSATARTTEKLGDRGVAVVEAGGVITWELAPGEAHVRQDRGEVFYRVEHAADVFEVATSHAVVRVRGTCFRIVLDAYGTTVTVDEGTVEIANDAPPRMLSGASLAAPPVGAATQQRSSLAIAPCANGS